MKKTYIVLAVLMGVSIANLALANDTTNKVEVREDVTVELTVEAAKDLKFRLSAQNLPSRAYIAIRNKEGQVLYSEYTGKTDKFSKIFDLSNLADGTYTFVVETSNGYVAKPFEIKTEVTRVVTANTSK
ncbi:hypothetical protein [Telluribacter sp.]|jgi:hypothetical protein|uniref:hypothetical protein n=1 Tax=Telluribacter sp. TaxID=1978767 RepID=UPI002E11701D|nr:hypothetical protein [Telluribacter sp.]